MTTRHGSAAWRAKQYVHPRPADVPARAPVKIVDGEERIVRIEHILEQLQSERAEFKRLVANAIRVKRPAANIRKRRAPKP